MHDVFLRHFAFLRWRWLSHKERRIGHETVRVHLREVDSCMLTWASEDNYSKQVAQLGSGFHWRRNAMVTFTFPDWITVVMKIKDPRLQFWVLSKKFLRLQRRIDKQEMAEQIDKYFGYSNFIGICHTSEFPWLCKYADWLPKRLISQAPLTFKKLRGTKFNRFLLL